MEASYVENFTESWPMDVDWRVVRFVVLDTETTGFDAKRDRIITIGALAVVDGEILLEDSFEVMLPIAYNNSSVTVHGITRDEALGGMREDQALGEFVEYLKDGVIVGHHIGHDIEALSCALDRQFGFRLRNEWIDTMDLTLRLERAGAFGGKPLPQGYTLDSLCEMFDVPAHDRHTAGGDALLTALVLLRLLKAARRMGWNELGQLCERYEEVAQ
jgi:DNA polymerase-3 subunit epsilon